MNIGSNCCLHWGISTKYSYWVKLFWTWELCRNICWISLGLLSVSVRWLVILMKERWRWFWSEPLLSVSHRRRPHHCPWWVSRIINSTINHATTKLTCSNEISVFIVPDAGSLSSGASAPHDGVPDSRLVMPPHAARHQAHLLTCCNRRHTM